MTTTNPDDSVLKEQFRATQDAAENEVNESKQETIDSEIISTSQEVEEVDASDSSESTISEVNDSSSEAQDAPASEEVEIPKVDYSTLSKQELAETLSLLVVNRSPIEIKDDVEEIRSLFFKKVKAEAEELKQKFLSEGGNLEDFKPSPDPLESSVRDSLKTYFDKRADFGHIQEAEKQANLKKKYDVIDKIKELVNREESINKTFQEFRALQNEWKSIGPVPQSAVKELWDNYHHNVEIFYDYVKINNELKDLDLKKNLEAKLSLCEKAEALLNESNPVNSFRKLQGLHEQWREIGPVAPDQRNSVWERFKAASTKINELHHEYFSKQKKEQKKNLDAKIELCEAVEAINQIECKSYNDFNTQSAKIQEYQEKWKQTGFSNKKQNTKLYLRFRAACDAFYDKKRQFYQENKDTQAENLKKKIALCEKAEAIQDSTDWKATTDTLIQLQKEWKEIGTIPFNQTEKCLKRFRKACDHFFENKSKHFADIDSVYEENLKAKLAIIEELNNFTPGDDATEAFEQLNDIQERWAKIGFVPFNKKKEITKQYNASLNEQIDKLNVSVEDLNVLKYKSKIDGLKSNPKLSRKVLLEREKFYQKIKQLENDVVTWENNIGFFAKSANADAMIKEVEAKIENAKKMIKTLEEKVKMIDESCLDE